MKDAIASNLAGFGLIGPEALLVASACAFFLMAAMIRFLPAGPAADRSIVTTWGFLAVSVMFLAIAAWIPSLQLFVEASPASLLRFDTLAFYVKGLSLFGGVLVILLSWRHIPARHAGEYFGMLLVVVAGLNFVAMANDLIGLFLSLEMVSIPTYVLLALARGDNAGQEATAKYFLLSIFSSAFLLYGLSFLYGITGSTNIEVLRTVLLGREVAEMPGLLLLALLFVVAGLAFRITAVPFHFYSPDVFMGTSPAMAAFLSYVPKVAGFAALLRLVGGVALLPTNLQISASHAMPMETLATVMGVLAAITMFVGNTLALVQTDLRRILAYSGVAHSGYMLVALSVGQPGAMMVPAAQAVLFYLAVYGAMTLGVFAVLAAIARTERGVETVDDLKGLYHHHPILAASLAVFIFSLIGLPPTGGMIGKLQILLALLSWPSPVFWTLALVLAVNAVIGAVYYLRIIITIYSPVKNPHYTRSTDVASAIVVAICLLLTLGLFFAADPLLRLLQNLY